MSERVFRRWDKSQVRQHQATMVSVCLLVITGLPLRYAKTSTAQTFVTVFGGAGVAGILHRVGAVGLIACSVWHLLYLLLRARRGGLSTAMLPAVKDVRDVFWQLRFLLGREDHDARWERYNFIEKFEYWAMVWGTLVMIVTGAILWFPTVSARFVTDLGIDLSTVIHGYEALLATLSILVWHMYHAHLRADVFPMNRMWLTGTMTESEMRHHHPLELEAILRAESEAARAAAAAQPRPGETDEPTTLRPAAEPGGSAPGPGLQQLPEAAGDPPGDARVSDAGDRPAADGSAGHRH